MAKKWAIAIKRMASNDSISDAAIAPIERRALHINDAAACYGVGRNTIYKLMSEEARTSKDPPGVAWFHATIWKRFTRGRVIMHFPKSVKPADDRASNRPQICICTHWQALRVFSYHKPSDLPRRAAGQAVS